MCTFDLLSVFNISTTISSPFLHHIFSGSKSHFCRERHQFSETTGVTGGDRGTRGRGAAGIDGKLLRGMRATFVANGTWTRI